MRISTAHDGAAYISPHQLFDFDRIDELLAHVAHVIGLPGESLLLFDEAGQAVTPESIKNSSRSTADRDEEALNIIVFSHQIMSRDPGELASEMLQGVKFEAVPPPITMLLDPFASTEDISNIAALNSRLQICDAHHQRCLSLHSAIHIQARSLEIALANLQSHLEILLQQSEIWRLSMAKILEEQNNLVNQYEADLARVEKVRIHPSLTKGRENHLGDFVTRDRMMAVGKTCSTLLVSNEGKVQQYSSLLESLVIDVNNLSAAAEHIIDFVEVNAAMVECEQAMDRSRNILDLLVAHDTGQQVIPPERMPELLEELIELDTFQREDLLTLTRFKNDASSNVLQHLFHITEMSSRVEPLNKLRTDLDRLISTTEPPFSHLLKLAELFPSYTLGLAEVVRRSEYGVWLRYKIAALQEVLSIVSMEESLRRSQIELGRGLPAQCSVEVLDTPKIDITITASGSANAIKVEREDVLAIFQEVEEFGDLRSKIEDIFARSDTLEEAWERLVIQNDIIKRFKNQSGSKFPLRSNMIELKSSSAPNMIPGITRSRILTHSGSNVPLHASITALSQSTSLSELDFERLQRERDDAVSEMARMEDELESLRLSTETFEAERKEWDSHRLRMEADYQQIQHRADQAELEISRTQSALVASESALNQLKKEQAVHQKAQAASAALLRNLEGQAKAAKEGGEISAQALRDAQMNWDSEKAVMECRIDSITNELNVIEATTSAARENTIEACSQAYRYYDCCQAVLATLNANSLSTELKANTENNEADPELGRKQCRDLSIIQNFDLSVFTEAIAKNAAQIRKWQKEAKLWKEKVKDKVTFRAFAIGDLVLFLPTRSSTPAQKNFAAFNVSYPHYFMSSSSNVTTPPPNRDWILAKIVSMQEYVVDLQEPTFNPYSLSPGVKFHILQVEQWVHPAQSNSRSARSTTITSPRSRILRSHRSSPERISSPENNRNARALTSRNQSEPFVLNNHVKHSKSSPKAESRQEILDDFPTQQLDPRILRPKSSLSRSSDSSSSAPALLAPTAIVSRDTQDFAAFLSSRPSTPLRIKSSPNEPSGIARALAAKSLQGSGRSSPIISSPLSPPSGNLSAPPSASPYVSITDFTAANFNKAPKKTTTAAPTQYRVLSPLLKASSLTSTATNSSGGPSGAINIAPPFALSQNSGKSAATIATSPGYAQWRQEVDNMADPMEPKGSASHTPRGETARRSKLNPASDRISVGRSFSFSHAISSLLLPASAKESDNVQDLAGSARSTNYKTSEHEYATISRDVGDGTLNRTGARDLLRKISHAG